MGTWEDFEAEQAEIEARRSQYPAARDALLDELARAWPAHPIEPPREGWVELGGTSAFREGIRGKTWLELPPEFVRREYAMMSSLPPEALVECLPAWLAVAVGADEGNVAGWLIEIVQLPRARSLRARLSPAQREAVAKTLAVLAVRWAGKPSERRINAALEMWASS